VPSNYDGRVTAYNSICGDRFDFFIETNGNQLGSLHFHGFGCAVSKASASVLAQTLEGKSYPEALAVCNNFLSSILDAEFVAKGLPPDFVAFSDVRKFPGRIECATLAWKEMKDFLTSKNKQNEN
jgi:nitrogen fixation NifU-like protein